MGSKKYVQYWQLEFNINCLEAYLSVPPTSPITYVTVSDY